MTELEGMVWETAHRLASDEFGAVLDGMRRDGSVDGRPFPSGRLQGFVVSGHPPINSSFDAAVGMSLAEDGPDPNDPWMAWSRAALYSLCRFASRCWRGIPVVIRENLFDFDDLGALFTHGYFIDLRRGPQGPWEQRSGIGAGSRSSLSELAGVVRRSPARHAAFAAATTLMAPPLREQFFAAGAAARYAAQPLAGGERVVDRKVRLAALVESAYRDTGVRSAVSTLRHFNRLVHRICWCLAGFVDAARGGEPVIDEVVGPLRIERRSGHSHVRLSTTAPGAVWAGPTHPVMLRLSSPLDGLYVGVASFVQGGPVDTSSLSIEAIQPLADEPPGAEHALASG